MPARSCLVCVPVMGSGIIIDIVLCIIAAWLVALVFQVLRQPLLLAYLAAGFLIGPHCLKFVTDNNSITTISSIGLVLLLFMIGLEIDLKKMARAGKVITWTAIIQIMGCTLLGWVFFRWVGPAGTWLEGLYLAVAAAMSSTVTIVKVLYDKREMETLPGRITIGLMVLQDLATILFLAVQPNLSDPAAGAMALALGKVVLLILVGYVVSRFVLPPVFRFAARLPELVLIGALAWCFAMAAFASQLGLSREMGALIAGVMVSTFPYTLDIAAKVTGIRDFFVTLFFVSLGMMIPMPTWSLLFWMVVVSMFLVGSRLITIFFPLHWMKLGFRASLLPAVNLSNFSELSLVLLTMGRNSGDVSEKVFNIGAFVFAFLAVDSTYAMMKSEVILAKTGPWLKKFGLADLDKSASEPGAVKVTKRICLLGFSWTASSLLEEITRLKPALLSDILVVDFNPHVFDRLRKRGVHVVYGDISQRDVLLNAGVGEAEIIICSLPNTLLKGATNMKLLRQLRDLNPKAQIVVHAERLADIPSLYQAGANYVSAPRLLEATDLLHVLDVAEQRFLEMKRDEQSEQLEDRKEIIP